MSSPERYAALFRNGRNQAVRIPRELEMAGDRVKITKDGDRLILEPVATSPGLLQVLSEMHPVSEDLASGDDGLLPLDTPEL